MNCHLLVKVADILHEISSPIVNRKCRLRKPMREPGPVNPSNEGWFRDLLQGLTYCIIPQATMGSPFLTVMTTLLPLILVRRNWIGLTRWSFRPTAVRTIPASSKAITWWGRGAYPFTSPAPQLVVQAIYFLLQLPRLQIKKCMAPGLGMTPLSTFSVMRLHHNTWGMLPISPTL